MKILLAYTDRKSFYISENIVIYNKNKESSRMWFIRHKDAVNDILKIH